MRERILIRNADAVVTCDPADRVLYNSDILICGNRIEAVGNNLAAGDAQIIDAAGKYVYPGLVNTHHHFFQAFVRNLMTIDRSGLTLMQWLDEVAGVVAMRHAETYRVVTAAVDNLQFKHAIYEGEIVVLKGYVTYVGRTSMEVEIDTYVEQPDGMRHTVNRAFFVMVAVDEDQKPIQVPELIITTEAEKARNEAAKMRRDMRRQRRENGF